MLNSLFCGLTFVYNGHTHASMVIFRFSILVYYLAIRSNYSSFKYGRAPLIPCHPCFHYIPPSIYPSAFEPRDKLRIDLQTHWLYSSAFQTHTHIPVSLCLKLIFLDHSHAFFLSTKHLTNFTPLNMLFLQSPAPAVKDHQWPVYKYHSKV